MSSEEDSSNESDEFYVDRILDSSVDDVGSILLFWSFISKIMLIRMVK